MKKLLSIVAGTALALSLGVSIPANASDAPPSNAEKKSAAIVQKAYDKLVLRQIGHQSTLVAKELSALKTLTKSVSDLKKLQSEYTSERNLINDEKRQYSKAAATKLKDIAKSGLRQNGYTQRSGDDKTCAKNIKAVEKEFTNVLNAQYNETSSSISKVGSEARKAKTNVFEAKGITSTLRAQYVLMSEIELESAMRALAGSCGFVKK